MHDIISLVERINQASSSGFTVGYTQKISVIFCISVILSISFISVSSRPVAAWENANLCFIELPPKYSRNPSQPAPKLAVNGLDKGKFLVASQNLMDPNFSKTVVLLLEYVHDGAMGVVINRPTEIKLSQVFPDLKALKKRPDTLYMGGPVSRNQILLVVKTPNKPEDSVHMFEDVFITSSMKVFQRLIERADTKERFRVYAGYAGWAPRQLDQEVARGDWYIFQADTEIVFDKAPSKIWQEFIRRRSTKYVSADKARIRRGFFR